MKKIVFILLLNLICSTSVFSYNFTVDQFLTAMSSGNKNELGLIVTYMQGYSDAYFTQAMLNNAEELKSGKCYLSKPGGLDLLSLARKEIKTMSGEMDESQLKATDFSLVMLRAMSRNYKC